MTIDEEISELESQLEQYQRRNRIPERTKFMTFDKSEWYEQTSNEIDRLRELPKTDEKIGKIKLNAGDWVSINRRYAVDHGKRQFGTYKILSKTVTPVNVHNGWSFQIHEED